MRMSGEVKFWVMDRGYGFVRPDDNTADVFVHVSQLTNTGRDHLRPAERVEFDISTNPRNGRPHATNVRTLQH